MRNSLKQLPQRAVLSFQRLPLKKVFVTTLATLALSFASSYSANADVPSELHYMVSPPGCQPVTDADWDKLKLSNGVWAFRNGVSGSAAKLQCPVNFYGNVGDFHNIQLWYIDQFDENPSSGFAHHGYVWALLKRRSRTTSGFTDIADIDSNQGDLGYDFVNNFNVPGGPTTGRNYYIEVIMYRENPNGAVGFVGLAIDIQ